MNDRVALAWLVPLRLLVGVILLLEGWHKLNGGWLHGDALSNALGGWLSADKPYDFFVPVIRHAHAHPKIFGSLITTGELAVGVSCVFGVLTRPLCFLGFLQMAAIACGSGQGLEPPGNALLLAAILLTFVFTAPGRVLGVDQKLRGRLPGWVA